MVLTSIRTDSMGDFYSQVEVESVLRIRPLLKKERDDAIVLEPQTHVVRNAPPTAILHPLYTSLESPVGGSSALRNRLGSDATNSNTPTDYHFNHVLPENTSQDKIYYTLGLPAATAAMKSLKGSSASRSSKSSMSHLFISMGVANSGRTFTCFGGSTVSKRRASDDGLVPRIVDSLFSQSKHHPSQGSKSFAVNISFMQVSQTKSSDPNACQIQDLLAAPTKSPTKISSASPKRTLMTVRSMAKKFEHALPSPIRSMSPMRSREFAEMDPEDLHPTFESCRDAAQAREVLQKGLNASKRAAKGHNHHLLIQIQPVVNRNQFGDKIAILDMAGLEKGKRNQSRGKDSVASNQAAGAAVLHCLRTMIHNTNVKNGTSSPMDIMVPDDEASEISCVSQEKGPLHHRLKPVPFRQHKVTMLLNPIFASSSSTKVTMLLNAYPGHTDYYGKRLLLQDLELLCGAALLSSNAAVATGFEREDSRSLLSPASRSTFSKVTEGDDESAASKDPVRRPRHPVQDLWTQARATSKNSLALSVSLDEDDSVIRHPPAYAPSYSKRGLVSSPKINPTAPPADIVEPTAPPLHENKGTLNPPKNPKIVSDFPGVALPSKGQCRSPRQCRSPISERRKVATAVSAEVVGGPTTRAPPSPDDEVRQNGKQHAVRLPKNLNTYDSRDGSRVPLGRSSLENGRSSLEGTENMDTKSSARSAMREIEKRYSPRNAFNSRQVEFQKPNKKDIIVEKKLQEAAPSSKSSKSSRRRYESRDQDPEGRVKELEAQMKEILREKRALECKCGDLENENQELKISVREAGRKHMQAKWTTQDEEAFLKSRRLRFEDQNLVKAPLRQHIEKVNYVYDIKNQWCMSNKTHFTLQLPKYFQRAPELDIRDKKNAEMEAEMERGNRENSFPDAMPAAKLTYESNSRGHGERESTCTLPTARNSLSALKQLKMKATY